MNESIIKQLSLENNIKEEQITKTLNLLEEGNTIPFIARDRKEATGGLEEVTINEIQKVYQYECDLKDRKEAVIRLIDEKGMLTEELKNQILAAKKLIDVEDLYRPFKEKKKTKATEAIAMGLEGLANYIMAQKEDSDVKKEAEKYLNDEVKTPQEAIQGAQDIIAEEISDNSDFRKKIRQNTFYTGQIETKAKDKDISTEYDIYYNYSENIKKIPPHRILAINRAEKEGVIKAKIEPAKSQK